MMSVKITEYKRVVVGMSENRRNVRAMTRLARRSRRHVDVEEGDVGLIDGGFYCLDFDVRVGVEGDVDGREEDGVVDEESNPSTTAILAVLVDEVVAGKRWDS